MYQRILVAVDGSEPAAEALRHAAMLAERHRAALTVLHVVEPPAAAEPLSALPVLQSLDQMRAAGLRLLERLTGTLPAGLHPVRRVEIGQPADQILRVAADQHSDLIAIGTHGRRGLSRLMLGSTAEAVLRRATCPVLTIRHTAAAA